MTPRSGTTHLTPAAVDTLRRNDWFAALPEPLQRAVVEHARLATLRRGEALFREGEPVRAVGVVLSGRVRFVVGHGALGETVAHVGGTGCWWGLNALRRGSRSVSSALAAGTVQTMVLSTQSLEAIVAADPSHLRHFTELAILTVERLYRILGELPGLAPDALLRIRLAELAATACARAGVTPPVVLTLSQPDLASMIGMSRQRLNLRLRSLQAEGLVEVGFRRIVVFDPARLRASAESPAQPARDRPRRTRQSDPAAVATTAAPTASGASGSVAVGDSASESTIAISAVATRERSRSATRTSARATKDMGRGTLGSNVSKGDDRVRP
jgi:CRP/FNR family cyclic AMP-dependent transcriptional regulator